MNDAEKIAYFRQILQIIQNLCQEVLSTKPGNERQVLYEIESIARHALESTE